MQIAILLYEGVTALDAVGPYEVLSRLPGARVRFVAKDAGPVRTDSGMLALTADAPLGGVPHPDVVVVPGGAAGTFAAARDERILDWIRAADRGTRWTTSVCSGALILGAAGLLRGKPTTTHWLVADRLARHGARYVPERVVEEGKIITAAGVSAGIDMALHLAGRLAGPEAAQALQLAIEYDPQPPFGTGSVAKAPESVRRRAGRMLKGQYLSEVGGRLARRLLRPLSEKP